MVDSKKYELTLEGKAKLEAELENLISVRRAEVIEKLKEARSFGDLSENSEYDAAKDEQAQVEARILEVQHILENVEIIKIEGSHNDAAHRQVRLGRTVTILDVDNNIESKYTIVGTLESDPKNNLISNESPLAIAMIGKKQGEEFKFEAPAGIKTIKIVEIHSNAE